MVPVTGISPSVSGGRETGRERVIFLELGLWVKVLRNAVESIKTSSLSPFRSVQAPQGPNPMGSQRARKS